jgi:hypothetical protein
MVRVGLETTTKDINENKLRIKPVKFSMNVDGKPENLVYKLPEVTTLPSSPAYTIKQLRDYLWVQLTHEPIDRSEVILLLADKKITEANGLIKQQDYKLALDTIEEAINKLKYADKTISNLDANSIRKKQVQAEIIKAGYAYKTILYEMNKEHKLNEEKYNQILKDLDQWNEEKQKNNLAF